MKLRRLFLDYDEKELIQSLQSTEMGDAAQFLDGIYDEANGYTFAYGDFLRGLLTENEQCESEGECEAVDVLSFASEFGSNHMLETVFMCQMLENAYVQEYEEYAESGNESEEVMRSMAQMV